MSGVDGRVIIVTGGGRGLGREYSLLLARSGAKVVVNDLGTGLDGTGPTESAAQAVVDEITAIGGAAVASTDSVTSAEGGAAIVAAALDAFGRVDGVVANAGILRDSSFAKMTLEQWHAVFQVHVDGTYHVVRAAWPHFREQSYGRIVVTSSSSGLFGNFGQANYAAAKSGLVGLANTLGKEGARSNILANVVAPVAASRMTAETAPPEVLARLDPAHVAPVVVHLMSDEMDQSGLLLLAGGGSVKRLDYFESGGASFDGVPSVDEIAARWSTIVSMTDADTAVNPAD